MADSTPTIDSPSSPRGGRPAKRGNSHNRNRSDDQTRSNTQPRGSTSQSSRGSRGGKGRGRGQGRGNSSLAATLTSQSPTVNSTGRPPGGGFGARLTEAASKKEGDLQDPQTQGQPSESVDEDAEVCFICASPIEHVAIAPCNHQTCHICSLRLRALYKTRACAHCRVSSSVPIRVLN